MVDDWVDGLGERGTRLTRPSEEGALSNQVEGGFRSGFAVDQQGQAVGSGVMDSGGEITESMAPFKSSFESGLEECLRDFENFAGCLSGGLHKVDGIFNAQTQRPFGTVNHGKGEPQVFTNPDPVGGETQASDLDREILLKSKQGQRALIAFFQKSPQGVFQKRIGVRMFSDPVPGDPEQELGMILADVVEIIGNAAADVEGGILFQAGEDGQDWGGILFEGGQGHAPGKAGAAPFAREASDMFTVVGCPASHDGQGWACFVD